MECAPAAYANDFADLGMWLGGQVVAGVRHWVDILSLGPHDAFGSDLNKIRTSFRFFFAMARTGFSALRCGPRGLPQTEFCFFQVYLPGFVARIVSLPLLN